MRKFLRLGRALLLAFAMMPAVIMAQDVAILGAPGMMHGMTKW